MATVPHQRHWDFTGEGGLLITEGEGHVIIKSQRGSTGLHVQGTYPNCFYYGEIPVNPKSTVLLLLVAFSPQPNGQFRYKFLGFTPAFLFHKAPDRPVYREDVRGYIPLITLRAGGRLQVTCS